MRRTFAERFYENNINIWKSMEACLLWHKLICIHIYMLKYIYNECVEKYSEDSSRTKQLNSNKARQAHCN